MIPLRNFLADSVEEVVQLQELFNRAYEQDVYSRRPFLLAHPGLDPAILEGLTPSRLVIDQYEMQYRLRLQRDRLLKAELKAGVLPLQIEVLTGEESVRQQRLSIFIEQVPVNRNLLTDKR